MQRLTITSERGDYTVVAETGAVADLGALLRQGDIAEPRSVVSDSTVGPLWGTPAAASLDASLIELADGEAVLRLVNANPKLPLFVVDTQDDGYDSLPRILAYLGRDAVHGQFKREMLACVSYSPGTYPLPLAYPDDYAEQVENLVARGWVARALQVQNDTGFAAKRATARPTRTMSRGG